MGPKIFRLSSTAIFHWRQIPWTCWWNWMNLRHYWLHIFPFTMALLRATTPMKALSKVLVCPDNIWFDSCEILLFYFTFGWQIWLVITDHWPLFQFLRMYQKALIISWKTSDLLKLDSSLNSWSFQESRMEVRVFIIKFRETTKLRLTSTVFYSIGLLWRLLEMLHQSKSWIENLFWILIFLSPVLLTLFHSHY